MAGCVIVVESISLNKKKKTHNPPSRMLFQIVKPEKLVIKFVWPYQE